MKLLQLRWPSCLVMLITINAAYSQTNTWTLVKNTTFQSYGTQGVPAASNQPPGRVGDVKCLDKKGNLWIYGGVYQGGGYHPYSELRDLWKFDPTTTQWTWMSGPQTDDPASPVYSPRYIETDSTSPGLRKGSPLFTDTAGFVWLYGGHNYSDWRNIVDNFGDLWRFNPSTLRWAWYGGDSTTYSSPVYGTKSVASANNKPGARVGMSGIADNKGNLWMFGGSGHNDLWKYKTSTRLWTWVSGDSITSVPAIHGTTGVFAAANKPGSGGGQLQIDPSGNYLWLYDYPGVWKYKIAANQWAYMGQADTVSHPSNVYGTMGVEAASVHPQERYARTTWLDTAGNIWTFGGYEYFYDANINYNILKADVNMWRYNIVTKKWMWANGDSTGQNSITRPQTRKVGMAWTDKNNSLWMFGGLLEANPSCHYGCLDDFYGDVWRFAPSVPLPVRLLSFQGQLVNNNGQLTWSVAGEAGVSQYEVERGTNGRDYEKIGVVAAQQQKSYAYTDHYSDETFTSGGTFFYRLKMLDKDGSFTYSNIVSLRLPEQTSFSLYPNPASRLLKLKLNKPFTDKVTIEISDMAGKIVLQQQYSIAPPTIAIPVSSLSPGIYLVKMQSKNQESTVKVVID